MSRRSRTLVGRVGVVLMLFQAIVALLFGWYIVVALREFHADQSRERLERLSAALVETYLRRPVDNDPDEFIDHLGALTGVRLTLVASDGQVLADTHYDFNDMENHRLRPEIDRAFRDGTGWSDRRSSTLDERMMYFARRIAESGGAEVVLRAAMPATAIAAPLTRLLQALLVIGLASLLVTLLVTWFVSRSLSGTVRSMAEGANRFAAGELDHRIPRPGTQELGSLATALNQMSGQIEYQFASLRAQRNEQHAILRSMANGVLALDRDQRIINVNRAAERMFGFEGKDATGRLLQEVVREGDMHRFVTEAFGEPATHRIEITLRGHTNRIIELRSEPLLDADDRPSGLVIVANDVTELRRLESLRSDFAANVSHELRTPITNIKGYIETLLDVGVGDEPQVRRFLEIIGANADRLASIIEDLLALARLESPSVRESLDPESEPVRPIIASVLDQLESAANAKRIELQLEVDDELRVFAVPQLIEQALANLLSNAIKYSPPQTKVTIIAESLGDGTACLSVRDEGPGIAAEHLPRLFERFYRVDKARSRTLGGTGLGLAIVKHIALAHGGRIEVESELGRGSRFSLILPAAHRFEQS
ncbi:MAG: ATP-binding protein [Phycisphaerales bacterium]